MEKRRQNSSVLVVKGVDSGVENPGEGEHTPSPLVKISEMIRRHRRRRRRKRKGGGKTQET